MSKKHDFQIEKWKGLINECHNSGMLIKDWCAANDISKYQYYYWVSKIRENTFDVAVKQLPVTKVNRTTVPTPNNSFVEVNPEIINEIPKSMNSDCPVAVIQKGSIRIEIMPNASATFIRQLLEATRYA